MAWWNPVSWGRKSGPVKDSFELFREIYGGRSTKSSQIVTPERALQCTVALACGRVIAQGLSQIPFRLIRTDGRTRVPASELRLYGLLEDSPNEWQTSAEFFDMIGLHLAFCNNAFGWINRVAGEIVEIIPVPPGCMEVKREGAWGIRYFLHPENGSRVELPASDVWHLRGLSWTNLRGLPAVDMAREAIGLSLAMESHAASSFSDGVIMRGILSTDASMDTEQRRLNREAVITAFRGGESREAIGLAVLSSSMKYTPVVSTNDTQQFIESRQQQIEEVCRGFGVMPIMVGYSDKAATYASSEQMFIAHNVHTMSPWYRRIEKSAKKHLLTEKQRQQGLSFKFNSNALLRGSAKDRGDFYTKLYNIGAVSPNEIRELEDMNPYEGGDQFRVPLNMEDPADPKEDNDGNGTSQRNAA